MSTLTRTNSHSKKPQYKDYVSFLDSYRNSKKDDQHGISVSDSGVNFSLNSSSNNSSSSVFSDVSDSRVNVLKEPLNNVKKKNVTTSAWPTDDKEQKATVKTEVFIHINNPPAPQKFATQVFEVHRIEHQEPTMSVSNAAKLFEQSKDQRDNGSVQSKQRKNTIEEISKKFEPPTVRPVTKRAASIGEVSKIFENGNSCMQNKPKNFNTVPKPFKAHSVQKFDTEIKASIKPAILSPKPVIATPAFPKFTSDPPRSYADSVDSALSSLSISPSPPQCASPPPGGTTTPPPPPPPLPPANFSSKPPHQKPVYNSTSTNSYKPANNITSQQQNYQTSTGNSNGTLDKNDPRVKKAVYGALRNMYGAYHDQANDYLSTIPKNRVKKNNGLDSIIDSIASQGGLEKLTGRVIPKQEGD